MDLVTIASFDKVAEAQLAKNLLEAEGVRAFLDAETASDMLHLGSEVKLQVAEDQADQARAILDSAERHELAADAAKDAEASAQTTGETPAE